MESVFLKALKSLVCATLDNFKSDLQAQVKTKKISIPFWGEVKNPIEVYNVKLSAAQHKLVNDLYKEINKTESSGDDDADVTAIVAMIKKCSIAIQNTRKEHQAPVDGTTSQNLKNLVFHIEQFLQKMHKFKFPLLNKAYITCPEHIVYYHSAFYLGEEIFDPQNHINNRLRDQKEERLAERLEELSKLIKTCHGIEEEIQCTLKRMSDLGMDNDRLTAGGAKSSWVPTITVLYVFELGWGKFGASAGRLGEILNNAIKEIEDLFKEKKNITQLTAPATSTSDEDRTPTPPPPGDDDDNVGSLEDGVKAESTDETQRVAAPGM